MRFVKSGRVEMGELRTSMGCGRAHWREYAVLLRGGVLLAPNREAAFRASGANGLENAAVFGGGARWRVLEQVGFKPGNSAVEILVRRLAGLLDFKRVLLRRDLKILLTIEGEDRNTVFL